MRKLKIIDVSNVYVYTLLDEKSSRKYEGNFEFMDVADPPQEGDFILWAEENCRGRYLGTRTYGPYSDKPYMRKGTNIELVDVIVVIQKDNVRLLHRYYG